jgi:hypothetical protein
MNKLKNILMLSCKRVAELIEKKLETPLSTTEQMQLSMHTKMCKACGDYQSQQSLIDQMLHTDCKTSQNEEECEELKADILRRLMSGKDQ